MPNRELSVIIPCHNEAALIERCLDSVVGQLAESPDLVRPEIIVVPNACDDQTAELAQTFLDTHDDVRSQVVSTKERGKKHALNIGLTAAKGEVVLCVDADVEVLPGAIDRAHQDIHTEGTRLVGAQYFPVIPRELLNKKPAPSIEMLRHSRRMVTQPHRSIAGRFMGFYRRDLRCGFPEESASADDLWLSAHLGSRFGIESTRVSSEFAVTFIPPTTMKDLRAQLYRFRVARPTVLAEFPQMQRFFDALDEHWQEVDGADLHKRWRQEARRNGVDFNRWVTDYDRLIKATDRRIALSQRLARLPVKDMWEPLLSTKRLPKAHVPADLLTAVS